MRSSEQQSLRALALELKHPLILIARQAELNDITQLEQIQQTAEQSLQLIDSYLLSAQAEYGQASLELTPVSAGSILYDAQALLAKQKTPAILENRVHDPIMTNRPAILAVLQSFGSVLKDSIDSKSSLLLRSYRTKSGSIGVGVFSRVSITAEDIERALEMQGKAYMPLSNISHTANISLAIADRLCRALGGELHVKHMGKLSGLATELPKSEQLALV